jgi:hypothetical protein
LVVAIAAMAGCGSSGAGEQGPPHDGGDASGDGSPEGASTDGAATFVCGQGYPMPKMCASETQYCSIHDSAGPPSIDCAPVPAMCQGHPTCACIAPGTCAGTGAGTCVANPDGSIVIECFG